MSALEVFQRAVEKGLGEQDFSAVIKAWPGNDFIQVSWGERSRHGKGAATVALKGRWRAKHREYVLIGCICLMFSVPFAGFSVAASPPLVVN